MLPGLTTDLHLATLTGDVDSDFILDDNGIAEIKFHGNVKNITTGQTLIE